MLSRKFFVNVCLVGQKNCSTFALLMFQTTKVAIIVLWCNGSTTDFGSVGLGSNPSRTTHVEQ